MEQERSDAERESRFRDSLGLRRIIIPILLGIVGAGWLLYRDLMRPRFELASDHRGGYEWTDPNGDHLADLSDPGEFKRTADGSGDYKLVTARDVLRSVDWTWQSTLFILLALLATAIRDLGYMYRMRVLTDSSLNWRSSFNVVMLWEFASSLTPSVVGGSGIAMFIIDREGIPLGRSTAVVLVTAMLDEIFYIVTVPLVFVLVGMADLFPQQLDNAFWGLPIKTIFWLGYAFIVSMTVTVAYAIFFRPRAFKYLLLQVFRWRLLRRWRPAVIKVGDDIIIASKEFRGKHAGYWARSFGATCFSWASRFLVINFIAAAFFPVSDHLLLYARQLIMWVILLISPTPGSSGVAEIAFSGFFRDLIPALGFIGAVAILWRILSYYLYLFIGVITLPRWLRRTARSTAR
ncbi:MAG: flippase-like domain-containing protein [Flavobacteriales bacterium]|nr:flippase-like domain-containing protein [Flavobacteriales bacterium]MCB9193939.1 flippase-like domain-containing protein [Flavobacteriales bacterium]